MKKSFLFTLGIYALITTAPAYAQNNSCEDLKKLVTDSVSSQTPDQSITDQIVQSVPADAKAIFIGEEHGDLAAIKHEAKIISALNKAHGFDCLFIEMPAGFGVFSNLKATDRGYETALAQLNQLQDRYDYFPRILAIGWLPAAYAAKQAGMKVFEFDQSDRDIDLEYMIERNQTMSKNMLRTFQSGQCHKAIALNGYYHALVNTKTGDLLSLPEQASKNGIQPYTLILRTRNLETDSPLLSKSCDYTKIGENKPYILNKKSEINDLFQEDLIDQAKKYKQEILPIKLDGTRAIVIY